MTLFVDTSIWYAAADTSEHANLRAKSILAIDESYPDQDFSIVDRTSFAVMQRLGIERVATLDSHFAVYRPNKQKERAFLIIN